MRRFALCIGNNDYIYLKKLNYAVEDAKAVAQKLDDLGFTVQCELNLDVDKLNFAVASLEDKIDTYDVVLVYYAGHGFQVNNQNLLIPIDYNDKEDIKTADRRGYPINDVLGKLGNDINKTRIIILDACRELCGRRGKSNDFVQMYAPQGSIIAFSTSPGQTADEDDGHGIYTKFLLEHLDDVRISIEEMFKRVRTDLARETNGHQISWEHTSLIGDFMLKINAIHDGMNYSDEAISDENYIFERNSTVFPIVNKLKSHDWNIQANAIELISTIDYYNVNYDDLFVLGRNIYQAACGNCFACIHYIDDFTSDDKIPFEAKQHILNGIVFEIYYNHEGKLRYKPKGDYVTKVLTIIESNDFLECRKFIESKLYNEDRKLFYVPGQDSKVQVIVNVEECDANVLVTDILYNQNSIYYSRNFNRKVDLKALRHLAKNRRCETKISFEAELRKKMCISDGYLKVEYKGCSIEHKNFIVPIYDYDVWEKNSNNEIV